MDRTTLFLMLVLQLIQLVGFGTGFMILYRKVHIALDRRAVSLRRLAFSAASGEHALALHSEVQLVRQHLRCVEETTNALFLARLLESSYLPMARAA